MILTHDSDPTLHASVTLALATLTRAREASLAAEHFDGLLLGTARDLREAAEHLEATAAGTLGGLMAAADQRVLIYRPQSPKWARTLRIDAPAIAVLIVRGEADAAPIALGALTKQTLAQVEAMTPAALAAMINTMTGPRAETPRAPIGAVQA